MKRRELWVNQKYQARVGLEVLEDRTLPSGIAPIPSNDVQPTDGPTPLVLQSLSYFSVVDGATLVPGSVNITTSASHGTTTIDPSTGNITYVANAGFAGTDRVGFTVTNSNGLTSQPAFVNEIVTLPSANPDSAGTEAGQPVVIPVLANDSSVAAPLDPTTVTITSAPTHGTTSLDAQTGDVTYTSAQGFAGTDTFSYTVKDMNGVVSNPAVVSVVVSRPQANDTFATTPERTAVVIPVLAQDAGPSALMPGTVHVTGGPADGTTSVNATTGAVTYTPNGGFAGMDSFTYTVADANGAVSNPATVTVAVTAPTGGGADVFSPVVTSTGAATPVAINVLASDSSPVGFAPATMTVSTAPTHGTTAVNATTGVITYTPAAGFTGTDIFTYTVKDNNGTAGSATVAVVVNSPRANDNFGITASGQSVVIPVLASDSDADNTLVPSSVKIVVAPAHGTATVDPTTGNVTYTADATFAGTDSFTYTVANTNNVVSNRATVTVIANRPGASDAFGTTDSGFPITINTLTGDTDPAGSSALVPGSVTILSGPSNGTATIDPTTGNITYTSIVGFNGTDTMTYTVAATSGAVSNVGTISIVVNRPTAEPDSATTTENTPVAINVAANDSDPDGNQFLVATSVKITTQPANGHATVSGSGMVIYAPNYGFTGTDTFAYTIADDHGAVSNPAIDTVTVLGSTHIAPVLFYLPAQPQAPATAGQSANALFVGGLYRDILGRQADTAGLNYWVGQLQGGMSQAAVAQGFLHSTEHLSAEVTSYYEAFLNRAPDAAGLAFWVADLQSGATEQQVVSGIAGSHEFQSLHNSSTLFVNALYSDLLGRTGDAAGIAFWTGQLNSGAMTDAQVVLGFLNAREAQHQVVDNFYVAFLGRAADSNGLTGWLNTLQSNGATLDAVAAGFLASSEYGSDLGTGIR